LDRSFSDVRTSLRQVRLGDLQAVPEPSSLALIAMAGIPAGFAVRRRKGR
jgi:hypothetical protein